MQLSQLHTHSRRSSGSKLPLLRRPRRPVAARRMTKASTFVSMFAFFGVYWSIYGWPLALGLVLAIYIHEMGHVAMLRRLGIDAGAPMFIPGVGAFVMLKQHIQDPLTDAKIGLAGPVWGLGAGLCAFGIYAVTGARIWLAIAQLTRVLNLFNILSL